MNADDLLNRYRRAAALTQDVDDAKIEEALLRWAREIGAPPETRIVFVSSRRDAEEAATAQDRAFFNWSRDRCHCVYEALAMERWDASTCKALNSMFASLARAAGPATYVWQAKQIECPWGELALLASVALGAASREDKVRLQIWLPILEAFEAGAFCIWVSTTVIYVSRIPSLMKFDAGGRLHCETGPAFEWLSDVSDHHWHGVQVSKEWIEKSAALTSAQVFAEDNAEVRRAGCEILGWDRVLADLDARMIDEDGDPQIGTLYEGQIPGADPCGFLKVTCGTGRTFVIPTPAGMRSAIEAQAWVQNVPHDAWMKPEVRG